MLERDRERSPGRSECRTGEAALQAGAQSGHCVQAARTNSVANALVAQLVGLWSYRDIWTVVEGAHQGTFRAAEVGIGGEVQPCLHDRLIQHRVVFAPQDEGEVCARSQASSCSSGMVRRFIEDRQSRTFSSEEPLSA